MLDKIGNDIKSLTEGGFSPCFVLGGGNICRGANFPDMERWRSDSMGMLATLINGLAFQHALTLKGISSCLFSSFEIPGIVERYSPQKGEEAIEQKKIIIFGGGTGHPFFTTDTASVLRAIETRCDIVMKATKVSGVFTKDPEKDPKASFLPRLSYEEVLQKKLKFMDQTAITLAQENNVPIAVFSIYEKTPFSSVLKNEVPFTLITK